MPSLSIRFTRKSDGTSVIACERGDGTTTWQRRRFDFFPLHDLTHYAVESQLGNRLLETLREHFSSVEAVLDLQTTVEIRDIERASYFKHPEGTLTIL